MDLSWLKPLDRIAPIVCAIALGAIIGFGSINADAVPGADAYREAVKEAIEKIPYRVGRWVGSDLETPPAAVKLLKPNKILQRRYVDTSTGQAFSLLIVHCSDTRDMVGHYPPICYPAHGWLEGPSATTTLNFEGARYPATTYEFNRVLQGNEQKMNVYSFFVLPNQTIVGDMQSLNKAASRRAGSQLGAAQVQIIGGETLSETERRKVIDEFVGAIGPTISVVAEGPRNG